MGLHSGSWCLHTVCVYCFHIFIDWTHKQLTLSFINDQTEETDTNKIAYKNTTLTGCLVWLYVYPGIGSTSRRVYPLPCCNGLCLQSLTLTAFPLTLSHGMHLWLFIDISLLIEGGFQHIPVCFSGQATGVKVHVLWLSHK